MKPETTHHCIGAGCVYCLRAREMQELLKKQALDKEKNSPWTKCTRCGHYHNSHGYCG